MFIVGFIVGGVIGSTFAIAIHCALILGREDDRKYEWEYNTKFLFNNTC